MSEQTALSREFAVENRSCRASHENVAVVLPCDAQIAPIHGDDTTAFGEAATHGIYDGRAGPGTTGEGQTRAAFPDAEAHMRWCEDVRKANIGALWEEW